MPRFHALILSAITLISLAGCQTQSTTRPESDATSAETNRQLLALGKAYHSFHLSNKKGPANWDEAMSSGESEAISSLRDKGCLVAWGTSFKDAKIGAANFVLAYTPSTLEEGGFVLLLDGSVLRAEPEPLKTMLESQLEFGVPK